MNSHLFQESLLEHVSSIDERTSTAIVTQLCLALADLVLIMPEWPYAVDELIQVKQLPYSHHEFESPTKFKVI